MKEVLLVSDDSKSNESVKQLSQVCFLALALTMLFLMGPETGM